MPHSRQRVSLEHRLLVFVGLASVVVLFVRRNSLEFVRTGRVVCRRRRRELRSCALLVVAIGVVGLFDSLSLLLTK